MTFGIGRDERVAVMGLPGTGKTTLCRVLAKEMAPTVMWDPLRQYGPPVQSYRPPRMDIQDLSRVAGHLYAKAEAGQLPDGVTLGIEEAEQILEQGVVLPPDLQQAVFMGRNLQLRILVNLRRPQDLTKKLLRICDHLFIMKLAGADIDYMVKWIGGVEGKRLEAMRGWVKDPREGGGRFFQYHNGDLTEHKPLPARLAKR